MIQPLRIKSIPEHIMEWNAAKQSNLATKRLPKQYGMEDKLNAENLKSAQIGNRLADLKLQDYPKQQKLNNFQNNLAAQDQIFRSALSMLPTLNSFKEFNQMLDKITADSGIDVTMFKQDENGSPEHFKNFQESFRQMTQSEYAKFKQGLDFETMDREQKYALERIGKQNERYDQYGGYAPPMVERAYQRWVDAKNRGDEGTANALDSQYNFSGTQGGNSKGNMTVSDRIKVMQAEIDLKNQMLEYANTNLQSGTPEYKEYVSKIPQMARERIDQMMGVSNKSNVPSSTKNPTQSSIDSNSSQNTGLSAPNTKSSFPKVNKLVDGIINGAIDPSGNDAQKLFNSMTDNEQKEAYRILKEKGIL